MIMPYMAVLYSQKGCEYCQPTNVNQHLSHLASMGGTVPDATELARIQNTLPVHLNGKPNRLLVLVPDSWLSTSSYVTEEATPKKLWPLAALSHAVEMTFSSPETVWFSYHNRETDQGQSKLDVIACSADLAHVLLEPFSSQGYDCLLMTYGQWGALQAKKKPWSYVTRHSLSPYLFEKDESKKVKVLWLVLLLASVVIHLCGYVYWQELDRLSNHALAVRQDTHQKRLDWVGHKEEHDFVNPMLTLSRGLPSSVFLLALQAEKNIGLMRLTATRSELTTLQQSWKKHHPSWNIDVSPYELQPSFNQEGVWDVSFSIHKNGH